MGCRYFTSFASTSSQFPLPNALSLTSNFWVNQRSKWFSYFNGEYHLFYQSYPFGAVHGLKSWVHFKSSDLVNWESLGLAVEPDTMADSHGAYSGSAREIDGKLFLMYTGNHRDENWVRIPYQVGAWMDKMGRLLIKLSYLRILTTLLNTSATHKF